MFGPPGFAYVFFVYGMHWHFNIVTGSVGEPQAVLIRAVEPVAGTGLMAARRRQPEASVLLTNGPGKLAQAFGITGSLYGADLCGSELRLVDGPAVRAARSKRIGIDYAGAWADKLWRFFDPASPFVSRNRVRKDS